MRTALSAPETATGPMGPLLFLSLAMHLGAADGGQRCGLPRPLPAGQLARDRPVRYSMSRAWGSDGLGERQTASRSINADLSA